jgi:3-hydroxymyristoyl/3-hydroxydecanoyl-(acyl carrier protein) dehydratase
MQISRLIPTERIIERLRYENPWWVNKQIPEAYRNMAKRLYFKLFYPNVKEREVRRALVLMGPRRVGKTVMLFHSIDALISEGVNPHKIFFVGIDNARFKRPVTPGDQLILNASIERFKGGIWKFKTFATVNDVIVTEADLMCTIRKKEA